MATANASLASLITLTVPDVAAVIGCSRKHVYTMMDASRMPPPMRIGRLVRWDRATIEEWVKSGCPTVRKAGKAVAR